MPTITSNQTTPTAPVGPAVNQPPIIDPATKTKLAQNQMAGTIETNGFFRNNKWFIILGLVAVLILLGGAWWIFGHKTVTTVSEAKVSLQIDAPDVTNAGSETIFRVTVKNDDTVTLTQPQLEAVYPDGV